MQIIQILSFKLRLHHSAENKQEACKCNVTIESMGEVLVIAWEKSHGDHELFTQ